MRWRQGDDYTKAFFSAPHMHSYSGWGSPNNSPEREHKPEILKTQANTQRDYCLNALCLNHLDFWLTWQAHFTQKGMCSALLAFICFLSVISHIISSHNEHRQYTPSLETTHLSSVSKHLVSRICPLCLLKCTARALNIHKAPCVVFMVLSQSLAFFWTYLNIHTRIYVFQAGIWTKRTLCRWKERHYITFIHHKAV